MQLWYAPTSPFARKVRVVIEERGLQRRVELTQTNPWTDERLRRLNPLAKVPTLVREDGSVLYESAVVCEYLDRLDGAPVLFPADGEARWRALLMQGLADGVCTAAGRLYADEQRPEGERSPAVMHRLSEAVAAGLAEFDSRAAAFDPVQADVGQIACACALGYLDFRWPERDWRARHARLADWFAAFGRRPSMAATPHPTA